MRLTVPRYTRGQQGTHPRGNIRQTYDAGDGVTSAYAYDKHESVKKALHQPCDILFLLYQRQLLWKEANMTTFRSSPCSEDRRMRSILAFLREKLDLHTCSNSIIKMPSMFFYGNPFEAIQLIRLTTMMLPLHAPLFTLITCMFTSPATRVGTDTFRTSPWPSLP